MNKCGSIVIALLPTVSGAHFSRLHLFFCLDGTCEMYSGGELCHSSRAGSVVFVDSRYNQSYLHAEAIKVFEENNETLIELSSSSCFNSLITLYCHLLYPDCLTVTKDSQSYSYPSSLCSDACFTAFGDKGGCASSYREAIAIYQLSFAKKAITPLHMVSEALNCSQLPSSADSQCVMLKTPTRPTRPTTSTSETGISTPVIIVAVVLFFAFLSLIIILLHRLKRRKSQNMSYDAQTGRSSCPSDQGFPLVPLCPSFWDSATEEKIRKVAISPDRLQIQDVIGEGALVEIHLFAFSKYLYYRQFW